MKVSDQDEAYRQLASAIVMRAICDYVNFSMLREQMPFINDSHKSTAMIKRAMTLPVELAQSVLEGWIAFNESLGRERAYASPGTYNLVHTMKTEEDRDIVCKRLYRTMVNKIHNHYIAETRRTKEVERLRQFFLSDRFILYTDGKISGKALIRDLDSLIAKRKERRDARESVHKFYGMVVKCPESRTGKRCIKRRISQEVRFDGQAFTVKYRAGKV